MTTNGRRNERAGSIYEKEIIDEINAHRLFPILGRSNQLDKDEDRKMNDIIPVKEEAAFNYAIQAKVSTGKVFYPKLLDFMKKHYPDKIKVILHKYTKNENNRYLTRGKFAIMYQEDFLEVIQELEKYKKGYQEMITYWDSISDDEKGPLDSRLKDLGL